MRVAVVGSQANDGTVALVRHWNALGLDVALVRAADLRRARPDVAIARLDVLPTLDGVEPGLLEVLLAEREGIDVRNTVHALLGVHDKLRTARLLAAARIPHPRTRHLGPGETVGATPPVVLKPRFGSWGTDVRLCRTQAEVRAYLHDVHMRPWYRRHGVLVQEEVPSPGRDLRLLVAGGRVVGAVERVAAVGEWRTNISCGGSSTPLVPPDAARELAVTAAAVIDADLVGVDLLPSGEGFVVIELNGAVDFDSTYAFPGDDVYVAAARALGLLRAERREPGGAAVGGASEDSPDRGTSEAAERSRVRQRPRSAARRGSPPPDTVPSAAPSSV